MGRKQRTLQRPQRSKRERYHQAGALPPSRVVVCATGKTGFTHAAAEMRLAEYAGQVNSRANRPQRIYKCGTCGHWHLTSQSSLTISHNGR